MNEQAAAVLDTRRAGVLLHVTSLPAAAEFNSPQDSAAVVNAKSVLNKEPVTQALGDFGHACRMIDFLVKEAPVPPTRSLRRLDEALRVATMSQGK